MSPAWAQEFGTALLVSEGLYVLANAEYITILIKSPGHRTSAESKRVCKGLVREVIAALALFIPVSAALGTYLLRPLVLRAVSVDASIIDGLVGLVSYGFPYAAMKSWIVRSAVRFLREAADVADKTVSGESEEHADAAGL